MSTSVVREVSEVDLMQQVVYAVSHDLRAPTRHIHAFLELLNGHLDGQLDEVGAGYMARLNAAADVFDQKLEALSEFSRVVTQGVELRRHSATDAATAAISILEAEIADAGAEVTLETLPIVLADPDQLVALFVELIRNSLKFCPSGPSITISSSSSGSSSSIGQEELIVVADDGPGFSINNAARAFELFRRFHPSSVPGTGTGLAIVKRIVEQHGGRITIEPSESCGARFQIALPVADPADPEQLGAESPEERGQ